jgi:HEAT repeat protein
MLIRGLSLLLVLLPQQDPSARALLDRLKADSAADRTLAYEKLRALGRSVEPELRKAADDLDPEVAARSRALLSLLAVHETLSPTLRASFPGLEGRLALHSWEWAATLFEAVRQTDDERPAHPELAWEDLDLLASEALKVEEHPEDLQKICEIIGARRLRRALPQLHDLLQHPVAGVRQSALSAVGWLRSPSSIAPVGRLLEDPELRYSAAAELFHFYRAGVDELLADPARIPDPSARRMVLTEWLGRLASDEHPRGLVLALSRDADPQVRAVALLCLASTDHAVIFPELIGLLDHPTREIRRNAFQVLLQCRSPARGQIVRPLLRSSDPDLRRKGAALLGHYGEESFTADLTALLTDPDPDVRRAATTALYPLPSARATASVMRLLCDPDGDVRYWAHRTLAFWGEAEDVEFFLASLREGTESERVIALKVVESLDATLALPELARIVRSDTGVLRLEAIRALGSLPAKEQAVDLVPLLASKDENVADIAKYSLGTIASPKTIPPLLALLAHEEAGVRVHAIEVLSRMRVPELDPRLPGLLDDADPDVRLAAVNALGWVAVGPSIPRLRELLRDPNPALSLGAACVLTRLKATEALDDLIGLMRAQPDEEKSRYIRVVGRMESRRAVPALAPLLDSSEERCRAAALDVIQELGGPEAAAALRKRVQTRGHPLREASIAALADVDPGNADPDLLACLKDPSLQIQDAAARALGKLGCRAAIPAVLELARKDAGGTRTALIDTLAQLRAAEAAPLVLRRLDHEDWGVTQRAIAAAGELELVEAAPRLLALARGDDLMLRLPAAAALTRLGRNDEVPALLEFGGHDLFLLNRLRRPDLWKRLRESPRVDAEPRSLPEYWGELACAAGLPLLVDVSTGAGWPWLRAEEAASILGQFEESMPSTFSLVLEEDGLRVLPIQAAASFWREWWRRGQRR